MNDTDRVPYNYAALHWGTSPERARHILSCRESTEIFDASENGVVAFIQSPCEASHGYRIVGEAEFPHGGLNCISLTLTRERDDAVPEPEMFVTIVGLFDEQYGAHERESGFRRSWPSDERGSLVITLGAEDLEIKVRYSSGNAPSAGVP